MLACICGGLLEAAIALVLLCGASVSAIIAKFFRLY